MHSAPTEKQLAYITALASKRGVQFQRPTTRKAASDAITALKGMKDRTYHEQSEAGGNATALRDDEVKNDVNSSVVRWGSTTTRPDSTLREVLERAAELAGRDLDDYPRIRSEEDAFEVLRQILNGE